MALALPTTPTLNQEFIGGGKRWVWDGSVWRRSNQYTIIDGGYSGTNVTGDTNTADGGNA